MRVFVRGFVLALLVLVALTPARAETASSAPVTISCQRDSSSLSSSGSLTLTEHVELSRPDDVRAVLEDSDEMLRVDVEQRTTGIGLITTEPKVSPKIVRNLRAIISPPLLV